MADTPIKDSAERIALESGFYDGRELPRPPKGLSLPWTLAPFAGNAADFVTTNYVLGHGGEEKNPLMRKIAGSMPAWAGVKLGLGAMGSLAANARAKAGHRTQGKLISALSTLIPLGAAIHNMNVIRNLK